MEKEEIKNEKTNSEKIPQSQSVATDVARTLKHIIYVLLFLIGLIVSEFLLYMYQYDFSNYSQDGDGYNNINTGRQGDVINGTEIPSTQEEGR